MKPSAPVVAVVQRRLTHYRIPFFDRLRDGLRDRGIELRLIVGREGARGRPGDAPPSGDAAAPALPWALPAPVATLRVGGRSLLWQACWAHLRAADLVVVEQASRLLLNYALLARQAVGAGPVAFWGHGRNLKGHAASRAGEALKALVSARAHWWFAYNARSARIVEGLGYPPHRITDVQNAIDTRALRRAYRAVPDRAVDRLRRSRGIAGANVGLFVGSMYPEKRLGFLIDACLRIRARSPDFEMLWIGDGPCAGEVRRACNRHPWMHALGPRHGRDRVPYFKMAKVLLMPGLVGLAVLDAFSLETPIVTTAVPYHSPEIEYLVPGRDGVVLANPDDADAYAEAVAGLLRDEGRRRRLVAGGRAASRRYTVEAMAERFAAGVEHALAARPLGEPPAACAAPRRL